MRRWMRRIGWSLFALLLAVTLVTWVTAREGRRSLVVRDNPRASRASAMPAGSGSDAGSSLTVATINVAHGRRTGWLALARGRGWIERTFADVGAMLQRERVDVAALQELDGPSWWSGRVDQLDLALAAAALPFGVHGCHVDGLGCAFGTAILSRIPIADAWSSTFDKSPPAFAKGFSVATLAWPNRDRRVDVVSVHTDFSRRYVRRAQFRHMIAALGPAERPRIVMGDFNATWDDSDPSVEELAESLDLHAFEPAAEWVTLPLLDWRIDWILLSRDLEFVSYRTLDDEISDHRAVVAEIRLRD